MTDLVCDNNIDRSLNPMPILKYSTVESMENYLSYMECHQEFEDVKGVPPLALIFLQSFMERAWTWKRLVPWTVGRVSLKDYTDYLKKYLEKNGFVRPDVCAEAKRCLKMEKKYVDSRGRGGPLSEKNASLSCKIIKLAEKLRDSGSSSVTAAAGLKCIAEVARLMSKLGTHTRIFKFSDEVRRCASKLMMYQGPESQSVAAAMLGMAKEARVALKLLKTIAEPESFENFEVCKVVLDSTMSLLMHLERNFVLQASATSRTDKTEGNSADDEFAGNKTFMDIHQNKDKKRKRTPEIKDSEDVAVSGLPRQ